MFSVPLIAVGQADVSVSDGTRGPRMHLSSSSLIFAFFFLKKNRVLSFLPCFWSGVSKEGKWKVSEQSGDRPPEHTGAPG